MNRSNKRRSQQFSVVHPDAAGIDIGAEFHVVAIPPDRGPETVRSFPSFTQDLLALADWLREHHIRTVALESTGAYWIPVFEILEARGFDVILTNARDVRNVPGRKSDVNDAQWPDAAGETPSARGLASYVNHGHDTCISQPHSIPMRIIGDAPYQPCAHGITHHIPRRRSQAFLSRQCMIVETGLPDRAPNS